MGLFGELDVASVSEDILNLPDGTHSATVIKVTPSKSQTKADDRGNPMCGITVTYQLDDSESDHVGQKVTQYQTVPQPPAGEEMTADEKKNAAYLKRLLTNLGVPEERMNNVEPEDIVGAEVYITVRKNGEYTNVTSVKLRSEVDSSDVDF